ESNGRLTTRSRGISIFPGQAPSDARSATQASSTCERPRAKIVVRIPTIDYVAMKCASVEGAILRHVLDGVTWTAFIARVTSALGREFGATVEYTRETHLARGTRS